MMRKTKTAFTVAFLAMWLLSLGAPGLNNYNRITPVVAYDDMLDNWMSVGNHDTAHAYYVNVTAWGYRWHSNDDGYISFKEKGLLFK